MASSTEPRSGIKYGWALGENNWKNEMDANLLSIGRFSYQLSVKDRDLATPPGAPAAGDTYIVAASPTGSWVGKTGQVAVWDGAAWVFGVPRTGWRAWIEDESVLAVYSSSAWAVGQLPADFSGLADAGTLDGAELVPVNKTGAKRTTVQKILDWIKTQAITWTAKQTINGDLEFSGNARRILGDFSNGTVGNRSLFQSSTLNGQTTPGAIPNGTSQAAHWQAFNAANPANASQMNVGVDGAQVFLASTRQGTGTFLPLTFYTGGLERLRINADGTASLTTNAAGFKWTVSDGIVSVVTHTGAGVGYIGTSGNHHFALLVNNAEAVRITSGGALALVTAYQSGAYRGPLVFGDAVGNGRHIRAVAANGDLEFVNAANNAVPQVLHNNGNVSISGFTKLGESSPAIKVKKLTGTTAATEGGVASVSHGLTVSKIVSVVVLVQNAAGEWVGAANSWLAGCKFDWNINTTSLNVLNDSIQSENILSKPFTALITYEE